MTYGLALSALADPSRRDIFQRLKGGPLAVGEIARGMAVSRPAVSQHLKILKEAGLVDGRADGARRVYYLEPAGLAALRHWLDGFWDDALTALKREAEHALEHGEQGCCQSNRYKSLNDASIPEGA